MPSYNTLDLHFVQIMYTIYNDMSNKCSLPCESYVLL